MVEICSNSIAHLCSYLAGLKPTFQQQHTRMSLDIDVGDRVSFEFVDPETDQKKHSSSLIQDLSKKEIVIMLPFQKRVAVALLDMPVRVSIWKNYIQYRFKSRVLRLIEDRVPLLTLSLPNSRDISRTTRREFFRVQTRLPARIVFSNSSCNPSRISMATIQDLSVSGCRLLIAECAEPVEKENKVMLAIDLPVLPVGKHLNRSRTYLLGEIKFVRHRTASPTSTAATRSVFEVGVAFKNTPTVTQDALSRYVAYRERQLIRQRGRINREIPSPIGLSVHRV